MNAAPTDGLPRSLRIFILALGLGFWDFGFGFGFGFLGFWVLSLGRALWVLDFGVWVLVFGVWCFAFGVWGLGFRFGFWGLGFADLRFSGLGFGISCVWFEVSGFGFRAFGLEFELSGVEFRASGSRVRDDYSLFIVHCPLLFIVWDLRFRVHHSWFRGYRDFHQPCEEAQIRHGF